MSSVALTNIATLVTNSPELGEGLLGLSQGKTLVLEDGKVAAISDRTPEGVDEVIDCAGKTVIPGFVDSHTHLVFGDGRGGGGTGCGRCGRLGCGQRTIENINTYMTRC